MKKLLSVVATIFFFTLSVTSTFAAEEAKLDLYVRQGCPHCAKVEQFLNTNKLTDKVNKIETFNNTENQNKLNDLFKKYNVPAANQGVPFLVVSETEYLVGEPQIVNYFAEKYDIEITDQGYQSSTTDTLFMVLGGSVLLGVLGYGLYSVFKKN